MASERQQFREALECIGKSDDEIERIIDIVYCQTDQPPQDLEYTVTSTGWPERKAWECPRCGAVNAPHVDQCVCTPEQQQDSPMWPSNPPYPPDTPPWHPYPPDTTPWHPYPGIGWPPIITCEPGTRTVVTTECMNIEGVEVSHE